MKTFEDAMNLLCRGARSEKDAHVALCAMRASVERYHSVAETIASSDIAHVFVKSYLTGWQGQDIQDVMLSIFINGVMIGMEMEKQEFAALPDQQGAEGEGRTNGL